MHEDHENAIRIIESHLDWIDKHMGTPFFEDRFATASYSKSALRDLYTLIKEDKETPSSILIEEFANKMDEYACMNTHASIMFSVAYDISMAVLWDLKK